MSSRLIKIIPLLLIIFTASFFRLSNISNLPPSLFADEVDAGYQADTFNRHLSDYFGNRFPTHFHSFSDWRTSAYIYSISFTKLFVSNPQFSVRLPSAIFSILSVLIFYLITRSKLSALLLAISPWSIHYGRTGFEVSGMIFCFLLGIYFLQNKRYFFSVFFFALTPYFYSTAKLFLILLFPIILYFFRSSIFSLKPKKLILLSIFSLVCLLPLITDTISGKSGYRFSYIGIFTMPHREQIVDTLRYEDILISHPSEVGVPTPKTSFLFHNKYQLVVQKFIQNYLSAFSTDFLFINGDSNVRHGFGGHGLLYSFEIFLFFIGLYIWLKNPSLIGKLFLAILLIAPIPFALTRDSSSAHATRLIFMLPSLIYFISIAVSKYKFLIILYLFSTISFWHFYTLHYPQASARQWHTGMKQTVLQTIGHDNNIYFSSKYESFVPFFLYYYPYTSIPQFQEFNNDSFSGLTLDNRFYFGNINANNLSNLSPNSILVIPQSEYSSNQYNHLRVINKISKSYINQEEFYLLSNE